MRKLAAALLGAVFVVALAAPAFAKTETIKGRLVDLFCYNKDKANTANAHKGEDATCAEDCAKEGQPVGLLTDDGRVYQVTGALAAKKNAQLVPHMSHIMELTGDTSEKGGTRRIAATRLRMIGK